MSQVNVNVKQVVAIAGIVEEWAHEDEAVSITQTYGPDRLKVVLSNESSGGLLVFHVDVQGRVEEDV
jgi:hypothetical protein